MFNISHTGGIISLIIVIVFFLLTACGYYPQKEKCVINPKPYKEIYDICLSNINKDSPKMVKVCEEMTWKRTSFCY